MAKQYAIINKNDPERKIIAQSAGFRIERPYREIELSNDFLLLTDDDDSKLILDLEKQLAEAQNANIAKEVFLSNMSHDIRTPMNAIIGMTTLAKKQIDEKNKLLDSLNKIDTASSHLLTLINEVLDMSRINSGKLTINNELFSLSDLLHDTLTIIRPQMEQKHHNFDFQVSDIQYEGLYGDPLRLRQIYVNIINNAIKYTNDNGNISVSVSETINDDKCFLRFSCKDNGIGMSSQFIERIFNPFERELNSTMSGIEGTGLGMSIVKKLVDLMNGEIYIDSKPNQGTTVEINIPFNYEKLQISTSSLSYRHLLIVMPDDQIRNTLDAYLKEFEITYDVVSSFSSAIDAITNSSFNNKPYDGAVLGKIEESIGDTFDLAAYLKKSFPSLPMVLISEDRWEEIEYRANRAGIHHFIPVPFFRKSLINGLNEMMSNDNTDTNAVSAPDLSDKHILLVEDNLINREIAIELLKETHAQVDTAENGKEALDKYLNSKIGYYDIILMDIQMPVMNGYDSCKAIRLSDRLDAQSIRIYAMSANIFAEDIAKAKEMGMNGHIAKPIDVTKMMQTIAQK